MWSVSMRFTQRWSFATHDTSLHLPLTALCSPMDCLPRLAVWVRLISNVVRMHLQGSALTLVLEYCVTDLDELLKNATAPLDEVSCPPSCLQPFPMAIFSNGKASAWFLRQWSELSGPAKANM